MKIKLLLLFACFSCICTYSQVIFQEFDIEDGSETAISPIDATTSDLDGDGDLDQNQIDISKLSDGIYFVKIKGGNGKTEFKKW